MGALELPSVSKIICTVLVGAVPKLVVLVISLTDGKTQLYALNSQVLSAIVAATIADMYTGADETPASICAVDDPRYGERRDSAPRICFNGVATSIISVFTALTLIQIDLLIVCAPTSSVSTYQ